MATIANICKSPSVSNIETLIFKKAFNKNFTKTYKRYKHDQLEKVKEKGPVKFTTSDAYLDYKATKNFYYDDPNLPRSHNYVLAGSGILSLTYLFFIRDDVDADGGLGLFKPVHETVPELAIPILQAAIVENRKFGGDTKKLEMKLAEYMKTPEKYGGEGHKLIEN